MRKFQGCEEFIDVNEISTAGKLVFELCLKIKVIVKKVLVQTTEMIAYSFVFLLFNLFSQHLWPL